jgi:hypothetical protein
MDIVTEDLDESGSENQATAFYKPGVDKNKPTYKNVHQSTGSQCVDGVNNQAEVLYFDNEMYMRTRWTRWNPRKG